MQLTYFTYCYSDEVTIVCYSFSNFVCLSFNLNFCCSELILQQVNMSSSHSTLADIDIDESISYEMHLSDSNDINFSDDFSDTSSSRYTNGEIKPRIGDII